MAQEGFPAFFEEVDFDEVKAGVKSQASCELSRCEPPAGPGIGAEALGQRHSSRDAGLHFDHYQVCSGLCYQVQLSARVAEVPGEDLVAKTSKMPGCQVFTSAAPDGMGSSRPEQQPWGEAQEEPKKEPGWGEHIEVIAGEGDGRASVLLVFLF